MALLDPIIHCIVDVEPKAFHEAETPSFAANLSVEVQTDGATPDGGIDAEETDAKTRFDDFLKAAGEARFYLFKIKGNWSLEPVNWLDRISEKTFENPAGLLAWLDEQKDPNALRYWTVSPKWDPDTPLDVDSAGATHRLRAAQAWNAPVGHKHALTYILRVKPDNKKTIKEAICVALPYFDNSDAKPDAPEFKGIVGADPPIPSDAPDKIKDIEEKALDYSYDPRGGLVKVTGRTNAIGKGVTDKHDPTEIDKAFTPNGYLLVDQDADKVRRLLKWLEQRGASLMAANPALGPGQADDERFEALFGIKPDSDEPKPGDEDKRKFLAGPLAWYTAARLVSALDNIVLALLKPVSGPPGSPPSEGEVLAPFVSALQKRIGDELHALEKAPAPPQPAQIAEAIRSVLRNNSPLMSMPADAPARIADALRHVYGLGPLPPELDEKSLVTVLLEAYATGNEEIGRLPPPLLEVEKNEETKVKPWQKAKDAAEIHRKYLASILGQSAAVASRALIDLEQVLHEEAGAEAAVVRLFETVKHGAGGEELTALLKKELVKLPELAPFDAAVGRAVAPAWSDYRAELDGPFNGTEAVRRAASSSFLLALLTHAEAHPGKDAAPTSDHLKFLVRTSRFYRRRFFGSLSKVLAELNKVLVTPDMKWLTTETKLALRKQLAKRWDEATALLKPSKGAVVRFIPDSAPQPLPIQVAANIDGSKTDKFSKYFNGIAVAIRRRDSEKGNDLWAHAHLCDLSWPGHKPPADPNVKAALDPMLPAVSDGRSTMFIEYEGFPFSDAATDERIVEGAAETVIRERKPFYLSAPHAGDPEVAKVPRLAYGRRFESFGFLTSNAGTLPQPLQEDAKRPWMPKTIVQAPAEDKTIGCADYQRRTAISQMAIAEQAPAGRPRRIGAEIEGVWPLAKDYPRLGLRAEQGSGGQYVHAVRDLFREGDGVGMMIAGKPIAGSKTPQNGEWRLTGLRFSGAPSKLILRLFNRPANDPEDKGDVEFEITKEFDKRTELKVAIKYDEAKEFPDVIINDEEANAKPLEAHGIVSGWLRLTLKTGSYAAMSFDNPVPQKADNVAAPLLLLTPQDPAAPHPKVWKGKLDAVKATITTPRVGYLDFERWFANADLRNQMFAKDDGSESDKKKAEESVKRFMQALLYAYVMRHLDKQLGMAIDRLPDPAVEALSVELIHEDSLDGDGDARPGKTFERLNLRDKLRNFAQNFAGLEGDPPSWTPRLLRKHLFESLDQEFQFQIEIKSGAKLDLTDKMSATVPEGTVARLSIDALVPTRHFKDWAHHPPVFDSGLMQYAVRALPDGYLTFPAAAVRVETMLDGIEALTANRRKIATSLTAGMIAVQPVERARSYALVTADQTTDEARKHWRLIGEVDITTQRFRTSGRPIYRHIDPLAHRRDEVKPADGKSSAAEALVLHPAMELTLKDGNLAQFELEAFFDRSDIDAQTVTQRLDPPPARTRLQDFPWNSESATYFRHRFTLRSRYAGALLSQGRQEADTWPPERPDGKVASENDRPTPAHAWTVRVAMLADLSRLLLTRPQLRALIPLTATPGDDRTRRAPPVAAILQEPPFARGGLADRIAAEIKTGFGYGFEKDGKTVEILDSHKEAGPNPHLDYRALAADIALGLVARSEGPLGLTFDPELARAPAFPNSMQLLLPDTLHGKPLPEEFFAGFAMRRYIDPKWTMSPAEEFPWDGEQCWWIDINGTLPDTAAKIAAPIDPKELRKLLAYKPVNAKPGDKEPAILLAYRKETDDAHIGFYTSKLTVDGVVGGAATDWVEIARVAAENFESVSILHQTVAPGRYSTALFVRKDASNIGFGRINAPLLVASFEWSPPKPNSEPKETKPAAVELVFDAPNAAVKASGYRTMASAPTSRRWIKTSLDFDFVNIVELAATDDKTKKDEDQPLQWKPGRTHVRDLVAELETNHEHLTFKRAGSDDTVWLGPSTFDNPHPLHVHRHVALITSRFLKELGSPTEVFCRTSADVNRQHGLVTFDGKLRLSKENGIYKPQEEVVRVVEFETPAAILGYPHDLIPATYKQAYFDLVATGFKLGKESDKDGTWEPATLRMHVRFVGSAGHLNKLTRLKLRITPTIESVAPYDFTVEWKNVKSTKKDKPRVAVGLQILLQRDFGEKKPAKPGETTVTVQILHSNGTIEPAKLDKKEAFVLENAGATNPGFFLSVLEAPGGPAEFWCDVSLLHNPHAYANRPFDLRWLFGAEDQGEPADKVSAAGLTDMTEAQARIVRVSPPIPIVKH